MILRLHKYNCFYKAFALPILWAAAVSCSKTNTLSSSDPGDKNAPDGALFEDNAEFTVFSTSTIFDDRPWLGPPDVEQAPPGPSDSNLIPMAIHWESIGESSLARPVVTKNVSQYAVGEPLPKIEPRLTYISSASPRVDPIPIKNQTLSGHSTMPQRSLTLYGDSGTMQKKQNMFAVTRDGVSLSFNCRAYGALKGSECSAKVAQGTVVTSRAETIVNLYYAQGNQGPGYYRAYFRYWQCHLMNGTPVKPANSYINGSFAYMSLTMTQDYKCYPYYWSHGEKVQ